MRKTSLRTILSFTLALAGSLACAQDYLLTTRGDSLTGEVRPLFYGANQKVQLVSGDNEKTTFAMFEVLEFSDDGEIYHPVKGEGGYQFMKLIQPGYLSLYAYQMENQTRFDGLFLKKMDGDGITVPNLGFKKYMSRFLEDCPAVKSRVEEGELGKRDLAAIVDAYNACIEGRSIHHGTLTAAREQLQQKMSRWSSLEAKVREQQFSERDNALEMIAEIRRKIQRQESIPNFLTEALRNSLRDTGLSDDLEQALEELQ